MELPFGRLLNRFSRLGILPLSALFASTLSAQTTDAQPADFRVGFAQEDVSTSRTVTLGGYGTYYGLPRSTRKNGQGIHDRLFASSLAITGANGKSVVIVGVDSVGLSDVSVRRIRSAFERSMQVSQPYELVISASHTHHAPDTMGIWGALPFFTGRDVEYMKFIEDRIARSALRAYLARQAASLSLGQSFLGTTGGDHAVSVVLARSPEGRLLGSLTQWSAHPTILDVKNNTLSADYVGAFRHYMEKEWPGTHVFVNGVLGSSYVADTHEKRSDPFVNGVKDPDVGDGYERMAQVGWSLFQQVKEAVRSSRVIADSTIAFRRSLVSIELSNLIFSEASRLGIIEKGVRDGRGETSVGWLRIGDVRIANLPGEAFASEAQRYRSAMVECGATSTMVFGMTNDWIGYLIPEQSWNSDDHKYHRTLSASPKTATELWTSFRRLGCSDG